MDLVESFSFNGLSVGMVDALYYGRRQKKMNEKNDVRITGKAIELYRLRVLLSALRLETLGMKRKGQSVYSIVKKEFGFKGSKESVYSQFREFCKQASIEAVGGGQ